MDFGISHTLEIAKDGNYFATGLKLKTWRQQPSASRVYLSLQMSHRTSTRNGINNGRIKSEIVKRIRAL